MRDKTTKAKLEHEHNFITYPTITGFGAFCVCGYYQFVDLVFDNLKKEIKEE